MNRQPGISVLSLLASIALYSFARIYPPEILISFLASGSDLSSYAGIFGNAPSFFYLLSIGLLAGVFTPDLSSARRHFLFWIALVFLSLEMSQHPSTAASISDWLATVVPESCRGIKGPPWTRVTFDPGDLIATLMVGSIAFFLLIYLPKEKHNAYIR